MLQTAKRQNISDQNSYMGNGEETQKIDQKRELDLEILADDLVHANLGLLACVVGKHDAYRILALFALCAQLKSKF